MYNNCVFYNISPNNFLVIKNNTLNCKNCGCGYNEDTKQLCLLIYDDVIPGKNINYCIEKIETLIDKQVDYEILKQDDTVHSKLLMTKKDGITNIQPIYP
jgi:hypothetical protein